MTKINNLKLLQLLGVKYYLTTKPTKIKKKVVTNNSTKPSREDNIQVNNIIDQAPFVYNEPQINIKGSEPESNLINRQSKSSDNDNSMITCSRFLVDKINSLEELKSSLQEFSGCELKKFATNLVFSDGKINADIMLIGEAPGKTEDMMGIPFCGESGKLLDNLLQAINISRHTNAYITNTVFWRPPANRTPTQEEIDICRPFVEKHIALINPKIIILVGSTAVISLFGKQSGLNNLRQQYHLYINKYLAEPIITTSIFHPAYLLRQPMQKKTMWFDLLNIKNYIENDLKIVIK